VSAFISVSDKRRAKKIMLWNHTVSEIRRRWALNLLFFGLIGAAGISFAGQAGENAELDQVLKQMEGVGKGFQSFSAQFTQKKYNMVLKEFDEPESGEFYYARAKDGSAMIRQEVVKPGSRILTINAGIATVYQPGIKQAQVVSLGKNKDKAEYLALGIGQSPAKLRETFNLKAQGTESIGGAPCTVLILSPRNPAAAAYFSSITLWVKKSSGIPIQEKLMEPSGDYLLVTFSGEKLNAKIPNSKFEQKLPSGVDIQRLQ
jgi:outer membrane lipoprotein-sorting protein